MLRKTLLALSFFGAFCIAGCGGGGSSTPPVPVSTITSVSVTCSPTSVVFGATSTCTANVSGTGSYSSAVSWAATGGTITSTGVATATGVGTISVTATSTQDTTKSSAPTNIAVTKATPTITWATPVVIVYGTALSATQLDATANVPGSFAYTPAAGTVLAAGTQTLSATFTPTDTTNYTTAPATVTFQVNKATPTITWATPAAVYAKTALSATQLDATANVPGSFAYTPAAGTVLAAGTQTLSTTFTPTDTTNYAATTDTVSLTVNPLADITSISPATFWLDDWAILISSTINGTGFAAGQTLHFLDFPWSDTVIPSGFTSTQLSLLSSFDTPRYSPGWITPVICENANDTNCGDPGHWAFMGGQNVLAIGKKSGEVFVLDQAQGAPAGQNGFVRKHKPNGTADGSFSVGAINHSIAVDETMSTGAVVVDGFGSDEAGNSFVMLYPNPPSSSALILADAASNGYSCFVQTSNNSVSCYDLTLGDGTEPVVSALNIGDQPWGIDIGVFGSETLAAVYTRNDHSVHKIRASDAFVEGSPLVIPGIMPSSTVRATTATAGGWFVNVFDSGPAAGIGAVLSAPDNVLVLFNVNTWAVIGSSIKLTGVPFRMAKDATNGKIYIAFADTVNGVTTFASIDPTAADPASTLTALSKTDSLLCVGLGVDLAGANLYCAQRNQLDLIPVN